VNTANTIMWAIKAAAGQQVRLLELTLSVEVAPTTGPVWRLVRSTAAGTATASVVPQSEDPAALVVASTTLVETAWSTAPTLATVDHRRMATPNSIGSGFGFTWFDRPFIIPAGGSLAVVNANATGVTLGTFSATPLIEE